MRNKMINKFVCLKIYIYINKNKYEIIQLDPTIFKLISHIYHFTKPTRVIFIFIINIIFILIIKHKLNVYLNVYLYKFYKK